MQFQINNRQIGVEHPTYIIAELSANHNGNLETALELVRQAGLAGADAVKLQTYTADTITIDCDSEYFKIKGTMWDGETLYDLYKRAYTPWGWVPILKAEAEKLGMDLFSSPFDVSAIDFLEECEVVAYKVASCEIVDHVLLRKIASTGKPVIVSTGMASLNDIESALGVLRKYWNREKGEPQIALLKCTSAYPAKPCDANLVTIKNLRKTFGVVSGLSDHTLGIEVPVVSVALGGCIIEKHFTMSRESGSPDDAFSLTPEEFKEMVKSVRIAEKTLGCVKYGGVKGEDEIKVLRRSLFIVQDVKKGDVLDEKCVRSIRPGHGLHTKHYWDILGKKARNDMVRGTPLSWDLIE